MRIEKRRKYYLLLFCLSFVFFMINQSFAQNEKLTCDDWHNRVDSNTPLNLGGISNKSEDEINYGIGCLLQLEGKKEDSNVEGATRGEVSQLFGATSKEVAALYYISYLFYQKWDHADAPFLVGKDEKLNSNKTVCNAYKSYRKWFKKVKEIGLEEARKQKLNPLDGSDVSWY